MLQSSQTTRTNFLSDCWWLFSPQYTPDQCQESLLFHYEKDRQLWERERKIDPISNTLTLSFVSSSLSSVIQQDCWSPVYGSQFSFIPVSCVIRDVSLKADGGGLWGHRTDGAAVDMGPKEGPTLATVSEGKVDGREGKGTGNSPRFPRQDTALL